MSRKRFQEAFFDSYNNGPVSYLSSSQEGRWVL